MRKAFATVAALVFCYFLIAQNSFQASYFVEYKNGKGDVSRMMVKVMDSMVYFKSLEGGLSKYDYFILNLSNREFFTISQVDKRIIIKYDLDKLLELYETEKLKPGFKRIPSTAYKATEETRQGDGFKETKYVSETGSFWLANTTFNFDQLIPLLRLMNNWNDAQVNSGTIVSGEFENHGDKEKSTLRVVIGKEGVMKEYFELPKDYKQKDFSTLVEEEKKNKSLRSVIQAFAGF